jgi:hypothetical protein
MNPAATPDPPYTAVIFTSVRTAEDGDAYARTAEEMEQLAGTQPGFLGVESARTDLGITVSYWATPADARAAPDRDQPILPGAARHVLSTCRHRLARRRR